MAYKALLFGTDDLFNELKPFYDREVQRGSFEIVATAVLENGEIRFIINKTNREELSDSIDIDLVIVSSWENFYEQMKQLEGMGVPRNRIIDGRVFFRMINLDFPRLVNEGKAYGQFNFAGDSLNYIAVTTIYPRICRFPNSDLVLKIDKKSYIAGCSIMGVGLLSTGKYCSISWGEKFMLDNNGGHNYRNVFSFGDFDWFFPEEFYQPQGMCKILIGNDVWIGRDCTLKCTNPAKPLVIGDGAVIASDSVVVKSVPPYAIVGGNPAQIIKYRFPPHIIEAFLRIKWWDWSLDKIHDNFKYFNDVEKFISLHDKED